MRAALVRIALAGVLCLVAACGKDSPAPKPYAGASTLASASESASVPAEAIGTSLDSARAFLSYYLQTLSVAARTGRTAPLEPLNATGCGACDTLTSNIAKVYSAGGRNVGRGYSLESLSASKTPTGADFAFEANVRFYPQTTYASASAAATESKGGVAKSRFTLTNRNGTWSLKNWEFL